MKCSHNSASVIYLNINNYAVKHAIIYPYISINIMHKWVTEQIELVITIILVEKSLIGFNWLARSQMRSYC